MPQKAPQRGARHPRGSGAPASALFSGQWGGGLPEQSVAGRGHPQSGWEVRSGANQALSAAAHSRLPLR